MAGFELYAPRRPSHRVPLTFLVIGLAFLLYEAAGLIDDLSMPKLDLTRLSRWGQHLPFHVPAVWGNMHVPQAVLSMVANEDLVGLFLPRMALILCLVLWITWVERRPLSAIGLNKPGTVRFLRGFLIGGLAVSAVIGVVWQAGGYRLDGRNIWIAPTLLAFLPVAGYAAYHIVLGASEEMLMRGWMMQAIASRHGLIWGVLINSVLFGAAHLVAIKPAPELWMGAGNVALIGVFLSLYACKERSIWGVCGWHAAWNWLMGVGYGLAISGAPTRKALPIVAGMINNPGAPWWLSGGVWGPEASVVTTGLLLLGIVVLLVSGALTPGKSFAPPEAKKPLELSGEI